MVPDPGFIDLDHLTHRILVTHRLLLHCMKKPSLPKVRKILDVIADIAKVKRLTHYGNHQTKSPGRCRGFGFHSFEIELCLSAAKAVVDTNQKHIGALLALKKEPSRSQDSLCT